nr:MAG TPA: hypothetical protein [Siphoviridae sp. ctnpB30]
MYPKKAFSTREQDYSALLRKKLEEAEVMLRQLNPSMERGLALTKLDECLLWANVSIAGTGISMNWRAPMRQEDNLETALAEAIHDGMQCTISSTDGGLSKFPALEKAASSWQTLLNYDPNVNDPEEVKAWLGEVVKYKKAAAVVQDFYDAWIEEKQAREAHQNE